MSLTDTKEWQTGSDDLLWVLRALEPVVIASAQSIPHIEHEGYFVSDEENSSLHNQRDLQDALARLPRPADTIVFHYGTPIATRFSHPESDHYHFELGVDNWAGKKVRVKLKFQGPDTNEGVGLLAQTKNRVNAEIQRMNTEIQRQEQSGATAEPLQPLALPPASSAAAPPAPQPSEPPAPKPSPLAPVSPLSIDQRNSLWHRITNHPLGVQIIGGIIAALVVAGIIALITLLL